ncbi:fatty acid synthase-like [Polistes fuscatus]|uniref:fatty acid synthase-like n=1 Tax=Polistes fuscatus TaxID=30207 RepID=UPI001CA96A9F|nr:fatty acid synthase-like [Polistes fuscatus]
MRRVSDHAVTVLSCLLSTDGVNRSFDKKASGFSRSDSVGTIFLQRVENAKRVYAEVVNLSVKYTEVISRNTCQFPTTESQAQKSKQTLKHCGLKPSDVTYIEADGSGIKSMDLEVLKAIDLVYGQDRSLSNPLLIGSVKSNIGTNCYGDRSYISESSLFRASRRSPMPLGWTRKSNYRTNTLDGLLRCC